MKTFNYKLVSKFFAFAFICGVGQAQAQLVGKIKQIQGEVFVVHNGQTLNAKQDMDLAAGTELLVSEGASASVHDYQDHAYYVNQSSHIAFTQQSLTLKKGGAWVQSAANQMGKIYTANAVAEFSRGEMIVTFDVATGRSQFLMVGGEADVASSDEPSFKYSVSAGKFTVVDPKIEQGTPRAPVSVGYESMVKTMARFPHVKSLDAGLAKSVEAARANRTIASVEEKSAPAQGKIIWMKTTETATRLPASAEGSGVKYFKKKLRHSSQRQAKSHNMSAVKMRVFGTVAPAAQRIPASLTPKASQDTDFEKTMELHQKAQPKNPAEVQRLIDDLKSF